MRLVVLSEHRAQSYQPAQPAACISITGTGAAPARLPFAYRAVLRLEFDDVPLGRGACPAGARPCDRAIADRVADFVLRHRDAGLVELVVHCHVGVSRSPGLALGVAAGLGLPRDEVTGLAARYPQHHRGVRRLVARAVREALAAERSERERDAASAAGRDHA